MTGLGVPEGRLCDIACGVRSVIASRAEPLAPCARLPGRTEED
jgi:hypothetical protein